MKAFLCPTRHPGQPPAGSHALLSPACLRRVEHNLRALPSLHQECLHHATPPPKRTNPTKVSGTRNPHQLNLAILDTRHRLLTTLQTWSTYVLRHHGGRPPTRSVPPLTHFLTTNLPWLAAQPPAPDFAHQIDTITTDLHRIIDPHSAAPVPPTRQCVIDGCTGTITPMSHARGNTTITCSSGHTWEIHEWLALRQLIQQQNQATT